MTYNRILITLDGSELAERAIGAVLKVASPGAKLHLLSVVEMISAVPMPFVSAVNGDFATQIMAAEQQPYTQAIETRREYLGSVRSSLAEHGFEVTTEVHAGELVHIIESAAAGFDLLVMATHGRSGISRLLFGSVTDAVLRNIPCPMLIVPAQSPAKNGNYNCILVTLDGTPESEAILPQVEKLLEAHPAKNVVLMKVEPHVQFDTLKIGSDEYAMINTVAENEARHYLETIGNKWQKAYGVTPLIEVNFNNPKNEIGVLSRYHEIDLIAMATHGRTGIDRFINGSITETVLHELHQPMLIVRMPEKAQS